MDDLKLKTFNFLDEINNNSLKILRLGNMLPNLVKSFLIFEIVREISIEQNLFETEIKNFYLKNKILNKNDLVNVLKIRGISEEELHYQITLPLKIFEFAVNIFKKISSLIFEKDFLMNILLILESRIKI